MTGTLAEVCDITMGQAPTGDSYNDRGEGVPLIAGAGDFAHGRIAPTKFTTKPTKLSAKGDIILSIRASIGAKVWADGEYCLGRGVATLRPGPQLDRAYLWHWLDHSAQTLAAKGRGATFLQVSRRDIGEMTISLPPIPEQRRISMILDHADGIRSRRRQVLGRIDSLPQSIFREMFHTEKRIVEFGSVMESGPVNGLYRPAKDYGAGTPILRIDSFGAGKTSKGTWKRVRISSEEAVRYGLAVGDIVVNRVNALSHLGKSALIESLAEPSVYESNMMRIRLDRSKVTSRFVIAWLQSASAKQQVLSKAKKAINQASINQGDVRALLMPLPALERQQEFSVRAEAVELQRTTVERALEREDELFASLQSRAFRGEL